MAFSHPAGRTVRSRGEAAKNRSVADCSWRTGNAVAAPSGVLVVPVETANTCGSGASVLTGTALAGELLGSAEGGSVADVSAGMEAGSGEGWDFSWPGMLGPVEGVIRNASVALLWVPCPTICPEALMPQANNPDQPEPVGIKSKSFVIVPSLPQRKLSVMPPEVAALYWPTTL
jgi:hypothetical protein